MEVGTTVLRWHWINTKIKDLHQVTEKESAKATRLVIKITKFFIIQTYWSPWMLIPTASQWSLHALRTNIDISSILCIYCTQQKSRTWSPKIKCVINHHNGSKPISMTVTFNLLPTGISRFLHVFSNGLKPFINCGVRNTQHSCSQCIQLHTSNPAYICMHLPCRHCHWLELNLSQQLCY